MKMSKLLIRIDFHRNLSRRGKCLQNSAANRARDEGGDLRMSYFLQQLVNGVSLGAVYGLIALGYTMVYGIIGMINFAHGDIYMVGAFISLIFLTLLASLGITSLPLALALVLLVTVVITALYGWTVERVAYRPLRGAARRVSRR